MEKYSLLKYLYLVVAGKWWGDKNSKERPILALHGWNDNAGSFDKLLQNLDIDRPVLAIDMPGHGWSSQIYPTMIYHCIDNVLVVRRIQKHYNWDKVTFLTHSMGGITSFIFAALYPEYVDACVNLDVFKPVEEDILVRADKMGSSIDRVIELVKMLPSQRGCTAKKLKHRWIDSTAGALTNESAEILMKRGIKEINPGKFIYSRDHRLKAPELHVFESGENIRMAKNIKCHMMLVFGKESSFFTMCTGNCAGVMQVLRENAKSFEEHQVDGDHYFHLNNSDEVRPLVVKFFDRIKEIPKLNG